MGRLDKRFKGQLQGTLEAASREERFLLKAMLAVGLGSLGAAFILIFSSPFV